MISTLFSSLNTNVRSESEQSPKPGTANPIQPVLFIMQKTMPIFKDVGTFWIDEHTVIEVSIILLLQTQRCSCEMK